VVETVHFQTATRRLLDLMFHAVYSNKDMFLRELISSASDALDRLRFEAIRDAGLLSPDKESRILNEGTDPPRFLRRLPPESRHGRGIHTFPT
jgi:HSP90 family molecular chaperone